MITNVRIYRQIALESEVISAEEVRTRRRPIPGQPGRSELIPDPDRRGFKHAMIAIVFAGMYIEAALHLVALERLPEDELKRTDHLRLEKRVEALGVSDPNLLVACKEYREARRSLVHEKAGSLPDSQQMRVAQDEARAAVELVHRIDAAFGRGAT